jgi:hypothetical protein
MGNVWQVNAIMLMTPLSKTTKSSYIQPVGRVMKIFRKNIGEHALDLTVSGIIDATASRTGKKIYIHAANTDMHNAVEMNLDLGKETVKSIKMTYVAENPMRQISHLDPNCFNEKEIMVEGNPILPPAAVCALEIELN